MKVPADLLLNHLLHQLGEELREALDEGSGRRRHQRHSQRRATLLQILRERVLAQSQRPRCVKSANDEPPAAKARNTPLGLSEAGE